MGMYLGFTTISDENIARLFAFPPLIWKFIAPDDPDLFEEEVAKHRPGLLARLFKRYQPSPNADMAPSKARCRTAASIRRGTEFTTC
jgi:hypothetical protein